MSSSKRKKLQAQSDNIEGVIKDDGVVVLPTDTVYGIVASALSKKAVEHLYTVRQRDYNKPFIVLISSVNDLKLFSVVPTPFQKKVMKAVWPGKVTLVFPCNNKALAYLHRGTSSLAFRLPKSKFLEELLHHTGPLVAPSANLPGQLPAQNITEAKRYFGSTVDLYVSGKKLSGKTSTGISLLNDKLALIRDGAVPFEKIVKRVNKK